jgi:hypothetical protein
MPTSAYPEGVSGTFPYQSCLVRQLSSCTGSTILSPLCTGRIRLHWLCTGSVRRQLNMVLIIIVTFVVITLTVTVTSTDHTI